MFLATWVTGRRRLWTARSGTGPDRGDNRARPTCPSTDRGSPATALPRLPRCGELADHQSTCYSNPHTAPMGEIRKPKPVLLMMAIFSRHETALDWSRTRGAEAWGPLALASDVFAFDETPYYEKTMGPALKKQLLAFEPLVDPGQLAALKHTTNQWEAEYADKHGREHGSSEPRPLNLDPGYLSEAKLVLATTKDRDHRIYLGDGIFAEVTLHYHAGQWRSRAWTYPDYQRPDYHAFFSECRTHLRARLRMPPPSADL